MNALTPCHCICHARQMPLDELEAMARFVDGPDAVPERDDERRRYVVRLGGEEFYSRFEPSG